MNDTSPYFQLKVSLYLNFYISIYYKDNHKAIMIFCYLKTENFSLIIQPTPLQNHLNAKNKLFRAQQHGVIDVKYFLFRLTNIYA